jgi:hypothetical protein
MSLVIANAFSINMFLHTKSWNLMFVPLDEHEARSLVREWDGSIKSIVGHADTAKIMSGLLKTTVECNRVSYGYNPHDELLIGQYSGPRLPEGTSVLPEGATIKWWHVRAPQ